MLETFKARLKAKLKDFKAQNLTQKRIDAFADRLHKKNPDVTDEAEHDTLIDDLNELVSFADVAKEDDRVRTLEAKSKKQPTPAKKKPQDADPDDDDDDDDDDDEPVVKPKAKDRVPKWAKELAEEIKSLKSEKAQTSIKQKATEKLKEVPAAFWNKRALPEKDEDLDAFVTEVIEDYKGFEQEHVNKHLETQTTPGGATVKVETADADIKAWADKNKPTEKV